MQALPKKLMVRYIGILEPTNLSVAYRKTAHSVAYEKQRTPPLLNWMNTYG